MNDTENGSFVVGLLFGIIIMAFLFFIGWAIRDSYINHDGEIVRVEYRNRNAEDSREMAEDMIRRRFPSNKWQNADYDCSKNRVWIQLSNP